MGVLNGGSYRVTDIVARRGVKHIHSSCGVDKQLPSGVYSAIQSGEYTHRSFEYSSRLQCKSDAVIRIYSSRLQILVEASMQKRRGISFSKVSAFVTCFYALSPCILSIEICPPSDVYSEKGGRRDMSTPIPK